MNWLSGPNFANGSSENFLMAPANGLTPVSRRHFVKIMSASFMLAGLGLAGSGCRRPEQKIFPFSKMPENYVHGVPQYYATAMPTRYGAIPLVVKSNDGRPTKIEGNDRHPDTNGGTDRYAQASILNLYDPDRAKRFAQNGNLTSAENANAFLGELSKKAQANGGQGLSFLVERSSSPSRQRLQKSISEKFPQAKWYVNDPLGLDIHQRAASVATGQSVRPYYKFEAAKVIVSLDCDFLGSEEDVHNHIRRFAAGRRIEKPEDSLNRLYVAESLFSLTGFNSDHRLRIPSAAVLQVAAALATALKAGNLAGLEFGLPAGVDPKWIAECAKDLEQHRGQSLVVAGQRQPLAVHLLALALNSTLENFGKTIVFHEAPVLSEGSLADLAQALNSNQVETLVILGGNPGLHGFSRPELVGCTGQSQDGRASGSIRR
jgi:molybdopterin-containing oxidoreductase family iron-sulfur binding subunit